MLWHQVWALKTKTFSLMWFLLGFSVPSCSPTCIHLHDGERSLLNQQSSWATHALIEFRRYMVMFLQHLGVSGRKSSSSRRYSYNEGCQALVTPCSLQLQFSMVIAAQWRTPSPDRAQCPLGCCLPAGCGREQCPISAQSASTSPGEGRAALWGGQPHCARSLDDQAMKMNGKKTVSYTDCITTCLLRFSSGFPCL